MTFETAVARMQEKTGPYFGIIVENKPECIEFLNKLQQYIPSPTVSNMPPLRDYAFSEGEPIVAVTLSRLFGNSYNRWSSFDSLTQMLSYVERHPATICWVMWYDVHERDIDFDDLM